MQIEDRIKELLRIQAKINYYRNVINLVVENTASTEAADLQYPGLRQEFESELIEFCNARIEALGNVGPVKPERSAPTKRPEEIHAEPAREVEDEPTDPLRFLLKYKHLDGKRVTVTTPDGEVAGTVRGMLTPNIKVELDTGYTINVPPKHLEELRR